MTVSTLDEAGTRRLDLAITGMTCASCANRIERKLNKLDGVTATVNYATEKAHVVVPVDLPPDSLLETVAAAGYEATLPAPPAAEGPPVTAEGAGAEPDDPALRSLRQRLLVSALLTAPVVVLAMVPAWQFDYWQWLSLTLAAPVVVWGGWPFHRAAWLNARHGTSTMDTLVSLGTLAAFGWSLYALFLGTAGAPGMTHPFELTVEPTDGSGNIYLEAAAGVTTFLLAGRYFEVRSKRRAGAALRALMASPRWSPWPCVGTGVGGAAGSRRFCRGGFAPAATTRRRRSAWRSCATSCRIAATRASTSIAWSASSWKLPLGVAASS